MRLVICCNHSWPHVGGTEKIVRQVSTSMSEKYGHDVFVISRSLPKPIKDGKVSMIPCAKESSLFLKQLQALKPDHTFVYSDCFSFWSTIVDNAEKITGKKSIALVGMNYMLSHRNVLNTFRSKHEQFKIVTHSDNYQDYKTCISFELPVIVIPNGINLSEFSKEVSNPLPEKFRDKKIVLCVSNFFPGKGQEQFVEVANRLSKRRDDFIVVFISSTVNFFYAQVLSSKVQGLLKKASFPFLFLKDIPRDQVVRYFLSSSVFAFPTQKEVAPVVVLEAMASKLPWVSMPVGNTRSLKGGLLVPYSTKDKDGYALYNEQSYDVFTNHLYSILENDDLRNSLREDGYQQIIEEYNWEKIERQYNDLFSIA